MRQSYELHPDALEAGGRAAETLRGGSPFRRGERLYPQDYGKPGAPAGLQRVLRVRPRRLPPDDGEKEGAREGL